MIVGETAAGSLGASIDVFGSTLHSRESFRASSLASLDGWLPMSDCLVLLRLSDLTGGGGGSFFSPAGRVEGSVCEGGGVGGSVAVAPLLTSSVSEGGFFSRDRLRETILLRGRCSGESLRGGIGDRGASWSTAMCQ